MRKTKKQQIPVPKNKSGQKKGGKTDDLSKKSIKAKSKYSDFKERKKKGDPLPKFNDNAVRLNKYLANAGICSRREADVLIQTGVVSVNDVIITEMGHKIAPTDTVKYDGQTIRAQKKQYVLLNKPKGFSCINDPAKGDKTVFSLIKKATKEPLFPVGRLAKDTTGLLLCTNDTDLAKKLMHPQCRAKQVYAVELDKPISFGELQQLTEGIKLQDGTSRFERVDYIKESKYLLGIELKNAKPQIISRTFEALGYKVQKLDRTAYADLTKKDLPRGHYRYLTEKEILFLKITK